MRPEMGSSPLGATRRISNDVIDGGDGGPDDAGLRGQGDDDNGRATGDGDDDDGGPAFIYIDAPSGEEKRK